MKSFSQRIGIDPSEFPIQISSMNTELRNGLWNVLYLTYFRHVSYKTEGLESDMQIFYLSIWMNYFKFRYDKFPVSTSILIGRIEDFFYKADWNRVYDFLEFLTTINHAEGNLDVYREELISGSNRVLKKERSAYRFVDNIITPIISDIEIQTIEDVANNGDINNNVKKHVNRALQLFSDRDNPDYRNSIKESISAVESYCAFLTSDSKASLGKALKLIETHHHLHPSLKEGFNKLYGYTSDESGIRHAIMDEQKVYQEDALFMLVSCSAFINYLQQKVL